MKDFKNKIEELEYAKNAVLHCLKGSNCSVDFHGITYWSKQVEDLRKELQSI
jgi:hypothetical protein